LSTFISEGGDCRSRISLKGDWLGGAQQIEELLSNEVSRRRLDHGSRVHRRNSHFQQSKYCTLYSGFRQVAPYAAPAKMKFSPYHFHYHFR
jgi:hypothetical protein